MSFDKMRDLSNETLPEIDEIKDDNLDSLGFQGIKSKKIPRIVGKTKSKKVLPKDYRGGAVITRNSVRSQKVSLRGSPSPREAPPAPAAPPRSQDTTESIPVSSRRNTYLQDQSETSDPVSQDSLSQSNKGRSRIRSKRKIEEEIQIPTDWRKLLYSKYVFIAMHTFGLLIGSVCLFVLIVLYVVIPRSFFGRLEDLEVVIFLILFLFLMGISYILVASFGFSTYKNSYYKIGYIFNGTPLEIFVYVVAVFYIIWIITTATKPLIKKAMEKPISDSQLELWHNSQHFFECCGIDNYKYWEHRLTTGDHHRQRDFPQSCCKKIWCPKNFSEISSVDVWERGCFEIVTFASGALNWSALVCMSLGIVITIIGFISVREASKHGKNPVQMALFFEPDWMMPVTRGPRYLRGGRNA